MSLRMRLWELIGYIQKKGDIRKWYDIKNYNNESVSHIHSLSNRALIVFQIRLIVSPNISIPL